jgi:queuosine biosynthesis protein QueC
MVFGGTEMNAVVLLSGGLDSTVTLAVAVKENDTVTALSFRYGQRHTKELESASNVCKHYNVDHIIMDMDLSIFRSALTRKDMEVPEGRETGKMGSDIPDTYVPARNIIMLSVAAGLCESTDAERIYIGANSIDYSGYPDCRPEFFKAFREMIAAGTRSGVEGRPIAIETPILNLSKKDIVLLGKELKAPLGLTWSCYNGREKACGRCDSCILRLNGFADAGYKDEVPYENM